MIKAVRATNYLGERVEIVLREEEPKHGLLITSIDGLGPAKANINTTDVATMDGSFYNSARQDPRNIVIHMKFTEANTIEQTRLNTYKYFPIKRNVDLEIETDSRIVTTTGYVESNEPEIFSKSEGNSISIICPDPNFYSNEESYTDFNNLIPNFEFPFSDDDPIEFGNIEISLEKNIYYDGEVEIGFIISMHVLDNPGTISIWNLLTNESMTVNASKIESIVGSGLQAGDDLIISTVRGNKTVTLTREGTSYNVLNCLGRNTDWLTLRKGDNVFAIVTDYGSERLQIQINNQTAYEGV